MSRTRHSRPAVVVVTLFAFASLAAGCSSSGSDSSDDTTTTVAEKTTTTVDTPEGPATTEPDSTTTETPTTEGGGGETGDRQAYLDAISENLSGSEELNPFTDQQVDCLGNGYIDTIGLDEITGAGVTPEEFGEGSDFGGKLDIDEGTANDLYDVYDACDIDLKSVFVDLAATFTGKDLTPEERACLDAALTDDALRRSFVADLQGEELDEDPLDALDTCIDFGGDSTGSSGGGGADGPTANTLTPPVTRPAGN